MNYHLGPILKNQFIPASHRITKPSPEGFAEIGDFIVGCVNGRWIAYDRICDHNGGLLCVDKGGATATCQTHKWTLNLVKSSYDNRCPKKTLLVNETEEYLDIDTNIERFPEIKRFELTNSPIEISFNAHASCTVSCADFRLTTDPWFIGSCFATGWWHSHPPSMEAIGRLQQSDCIYISHNHPDHLHLPTLEAYVPKDQLFLIPAFESKSVESILRRHGYSNLIVANFLQEVDFQTQEGIVRTMLVRGGDERDDSSLLIFTEHDTLFFGVDTNMPNRWVLPSVSVLFTPFAGGASGFPSRIANFTHARKTQIITANRSSILSNHVDKLVKATRPSYVVPYAGYFSEAPRDQDVKEINIKNSASDLVNFVESAFPEIQGINPLETPAFKLYQGKLSIQEAFETPSYFIDNEYVEQDVNRYIANITKIDLLRLEELGKVLITSNFIDELTVVFIPTDARFEPTLGQGLAVDFSKLHRGWQLVSVEGMDDLALSESLATNKNNIEILRIRGDIMAVAISQGVPLEDLSIGFQIQMYRQPNVYNFRFWDHFTNKEFMKI